jgi:hypothetical protein
MRLAMKRNLAFNPMGIRLPGPLCISLAANTMLETT